VRPTKNGNAVNICVQTVWATCDKCDELVNIQNS